MFLLQEAHFGNVSINNPGRVVTMPNHPGVKKQASKEVDIDKLKKQGDVEDTKAVGQPHSTRSVGKPRTSSRGKGVALLCNVQRLRETSSLDPDQEVKEKEP